MPMPRLNARVFDGLTSRSPIDIESEWKKIKEENPVCGRVMEILKRRMRVHQTNLTPETFLTIFYLAFKAQIDSNDLKDEGEIEHVESCCAH